MVRESSAGNTFCFPVGKLGEFATTYDLGSPEEGHPDLFRFDPAFSDLLRFVFRTNQGNTFLPTPLQIPDQLERQSFYLFELKLRKRPGRNCLTAEQGWNIFSRKGFCRNPRGIFPNKVPGEFCGGFFGGFFRAFFLGKIGGKNPPKNPRQNSNRNLGFSQPKSTLQGSGLDIFGEISSAFFGFFVPFSWPGQEPPLDAHRPWMPGNRSPKECLCREIPKESLRAPWAVTDHRCRRSLLGSGTNAGFCIRGKEG